MVIFNAMRGINKVNGQSHFPRVEQSKIKGIDFRV